MLRIKNEIKLDYLSFTLDRNEQNFKRVFKVMGEYGKREVDYGGYGYDKSAWILDAGRVFWSTNRKDMGIHVRLNSASLSLVEYTALGMINLILDWGGKITRADIAFDDMDGVLDTDLMYEKLRSGEVVTRYRKVTRITGVQMPEPEKTGDTVNVGSRKSNSFIRIYDKLLEQQARGVDLPSGIGSWVRIEIELKKEKAHKFCEMIGNLAKSQEKDAGDMCAGLLLGLLDFKDVNPEDDNRSRWETCSWWLEFVGTLQKVTVGLPSQTKTLEDTKDWLKFQVASSLAMVVLSYPDENGLTGFEFIMKCVEDGEKRMSELQQLRLDLYNAKTKAELAAG